VKIGRIPFVNMAPFFHFLGARWLEQHQLVDGDPRRLGERARLGELDAAPFSYVDGQALVAGGDFEWLSNLGISGFGPIHSILLCGVTRLSELEDGHISITPQTATTVRLLELLLTQRDKVPGWRFTPSTGSGQAPVAQLFIGDQALRRRLEYGSLEPQLDLCAEWGAWTGLPFVFARWAVRRELTPRAKAELALSLRSSVDLSLGDLQHVAQAQADRCGLDREAVLGYLQGIRFKLGPSELEGAALFERKLQMLSSSPTP
jgi:chorismate dehydratase